MYHWLKSRLNFTSDFRRRYDLNKIYNRALIPYEKYNGVYPYNIINNIYKFNIFPSITDFIYKFIPEYTDFLTDNSPLLERSAIPIKKYIRIQGNHISREWDVKGNLMIRTEYVRNYNKISIIFKYKDEKIYIFDHKLNSNGNWMETVFHLLLKQMIT